MESKLINYSIFIEKRPDMEVHTEVAINSCINSAYVLLDGECASLISQVDKFNMVDDRSQLDTNNVLYRTDFELGQLQEALVFQVQYVLNMGNDFTIGGGSYSIGNINSSYNRPEGRELIAPGVYKLLSNARVYQLNAFGSFSNQNTNEIPLSTSKEIMERVKNEYVAQNQPDAQVGNVAYINQSKQVAFGAPQDLQITTYNTNRIAGPEGYRNNFYEIDSVPNIAFFGPDYNGTYSAVHRQEMIDYVNQNAGENLGQEIAQIKQEQEEQNDKINLNKNLIDSTYDEVIDLLNITIPNIDKKILINTNAISSNKNVIDNLNQRVGTNTTNIQTNTNTITALDSRLVSVSGLLTQTIDGLRTLRPFKYVGEYQNGTSYNINQLVSYQNNLYLSKEDNNNTIPTSDKWLLINKDTISVDLSDYPTKLEVEAIKNNLQQSITSNTTNITNLNNEVVKLAPNQTISGQKTFSNAIQITKTNAALQFKPGTNQSSYLEFYNGNTRIAHFGKGSSSNNNLDLGVSSGKFEISAPQGIILHSPIEFGTAIKAGYGGGTVKFIPEDNTTKTLQFYNANATDQRRFKLLVPDPTEAQNPATKQYVDNAIQNTNITTIRNNYLDKTATGVQQIAAGSVYFNNQVIINQPYNPNLIPNADFQVSGQSFIENLEADNATFNTSVIVPTPTQNNQAANKQYVDNAIQNITPGSGGSIDTSNFATLNTIQTITGQKTFTNRIFANGGITNLPLPTNTSEAANKQYVDNRISNIPVYNEYNLIYTSNSTWNNLQTITINISGNDTISKKSWMINFARMGNNGSKYEGDINYNFILPELNNATFAGSSLWYNSTNTRFDTGANAGITILRTGATTLKLTIQCWDGGNRINYIRLYAPK